MRLLVCTVVWCCLLSVNEMVNCVIPSGVIPLRSVTEVAQVSGSAEFYVKCEAEGKKSTRKFNFRGRPLNVIYSNCDRC